MNEIKKHKTLKNIMYVTAAIWLTGTSMMNVNGYNHTQNALNKLHKVSPELTADDANDKASGIGSFLTSIPYSMGAYFACRQYLKENPKEEDMWERVDKKEIDDYYRQKIKLKKLPF